MKKILLVSNGGLPLPAVDGGAVETLAEMYINENERRKSFVFDVYSSFSRRMDESSNSYSYASFFYIKDRNILFRVRKYIRAFIRKVLRINIDNAFANEIIKRVRGNNYDLILLENAPSLVHPFYRVFGDKVILHAHNNFLNSSSRGSTKILIECKKIYTVSNFIKKQIDNICPNKKTKTVFNGVDLQKFNFEEKKEFRKKYREKYKINENDIVFLFSGRICDDKGVKELIIAYNNIAAKNKNVKLLIAGGTFYNLNKKNKYARSLADLISDGIIFTGYINYNNMPYIYNMADVLILPSKIDDACPMTVLEAMAAGLPIVASNCGGVPEEVFNNNSILLDRSNLVTELCNAMLRLAENKELIMKMSKASLERSKKFGKEKYLDSIFNELEKI